MTSPPDGNDGTSSVNDQAEFDVANVKFVNAFGMGHLSDKSDKSAWYFRVAYKGADRNKVGSSGIYATYRKVGHYSLDPALNAAVIDFVPYSGTPLQSYGKKRYQGTSFGFTNTVAKNAILGISVDKLKTWGIDAGTNYDPAYYLQLNIFW